MFEVALRDNAVGGVVDQGGQHAQHQRRQTARDDLDGTLRGYFADCTDEQIWSVLTSERQHDPE